MTNPTRLPCRRGDTLNTLRISDGSLAPAETCISWGCIGRTGTRASSSAMRLPTRRRLPADIGTEFPDDICGRHMPDRFEL